MGSKPVDLEILREILKDTRMHIGIGLIKRLEMAQDRSTLRVAVNILPEQREIIARMTWEFVGPSAGVYQLPVPDDLVLVGFAEGEDDQAFVIRKLSSKVDSIPGEVDGGDLIMKALQGKKARVISDTKVELAKPGSAPAENLVLGQIFKTMMAACLQAISVHTHVGNLGYQTSPPDNAPDFLDLKASPIDDEEILSDLAFTEK